jgi:4-diphosphocytidyl-2-C-methyl-D-erythritol kinase
LAAPAIALAPVIGEILERLRSTTGVIRAFMSGSGATCVAICETPDVTPHLDPRWWMMRTVLA